MRLDLPAVVAERRRLHARQARRSARRHGLDTAWGKAYVAEAEAWEAAARLADAGDATVVNITLRLPGPL